MIEPSKQGLIYFGVAFMVYKWLFVQVYSKELDLMGELWCFGKQEVLLNVDPFLPRIQSATSGTLLSGDSSWAWPSASFPWRVWPRSIVGRGRERRKVALLGIMWSFLQPPCQAATFSPCPT